MSKPKIVTLYSIPPYNKFFSPEFKFKEKEKFLVKKEEGNFFHLESLKTKRSVILLKEYFVKPDENAAKAIKKIID